MRKMTQSELLAIKMKVAQGMIRVVDTLFENSLPFELALDMRFVTTQDGNPLENNQVFHIQEWSLETFEYDDKKFNFMYGDNESREWSISCLWENVPALLLNGGVLIANQFYQIQEVKAKNSYVTNDDWVAIAPDFVKRSYERFKQNPENAQFFKEQYSQEFDGSDLDPIA
jgi:hypothetical protein